MRVRPQYARLSLLKIGHILVYEKQGGQIEGSLVVWIEVMPSFDDVGRNGELRPNPESRRQWST